jgi:hypothetical protein
MPDEYDPSSEPLITAIQQGNPADKIITAKNHKEWSARLYVVDDESATLASMTIQKCLQNKKYGEAQAEEVLELMKWRSSEGGKQIKLFADVVSGEMAMRMKRRRDSDDNDSNGIR